MSSEYPTEKRDKDNLRITLSPNLTLTVIKPTLTTYNSNNIDIKLVKEEERFIGQHKLLRKGIINFTVAEFLQLKSTIPTIHSFLSFVSTEDVQPDTAEIDEGKQHQTLTDTPSSSARSII